MDLDLIESSWRTVVALNACFGPGINKRTHVGRKYNAKRAHAFLIRNFELLVEIKLSTARSFVCYCCQVPGRSLSFDVNKVSFHNVGRKYNAKRAHAFLIRNFELLVEIKLSTARSFVCYCCQVPGRSLSFDVNKVSFHMGAFVNTGPNSATTQPKTIRSGKSGFEDCISGATSAGGRPRTKKKRGCVDSSGPLR